MYLTSIVIKILGLVVPLLLAVAFMVLVERKVMGSMQRRKGPSVVGVFGILQPIADAVKLLVKEHVLPSHANLVVFLVAPILTFLLALLSWSVIPFGEGLVLCDLNIGVLFLFAVSSLGVYGIIMAGWASNSKYAFLGAMRSAAQMVSYEVSIGLILITVLMCVGSLNLTEIVTAQKNVWFVVPLFPLFILFFISCLAETNRAPFDLPEAEQELVAGFHTEYTGMKFAMFFMGEYINMVTMSALVTLLFLGGWNTYGIPVWPIVGFAVKVVFLLCVFIWLRSTFPRIRYDRLMTFGWKVLLPLCLLNLLITGTIKVL